MSAAASVAESKSAEKQADRKFGVDPAESYRKDTSTGDRSKARSGGPNADSSSETLLALGWLSLASDRTAARSMYVQSGTTDMGVGGSGMYASANFKTLVFGCINTDLCDHALFQHFSISTGFRRLYTASNTLSKCFGIFM